jgi:hypothetical protein
MELQAVELQEVERTLREIFCEVLGLVEIEPTASFIDLGGVSLEAEDIARRASAFFEVQLEPVDVIGSETLREVAILVRERLRGKAA